MSLGVLIRCYHSRRMRGHQSVAAKLDNIFKPIETLFESSDNPSTSSGSYSAKRKEERFTRPLPSVVRYLEQHTIGSPRTRTEFRSLVSKKHLAVDFLNQLKPKTKFIASALKVDDIPLANFPEIAVVGRSNCGKSSLINAIVGTRCCQVVNKPGSTESLNFYRIGDPPLLMFVDVPGFGFSYSSESDRDIRNELALWYLRSRRNLRCVVLVADARHGLSDCDRELVTFFKNNKIKFFVAVNKCDLVESKDLAQRLTVIGRDLEISPDTLLDRVVPVSALRRLGIDKIRRLCEQFKLERSVVVKGEEKMVNDLLESRRLQKNARHKSKVSLADFKDPVGLHDCDEPQSDEGTCVGFSETEPAAYRPDEKSILKRVGEESDEEIRILDVEDFVSKDEELNLGMRGGRKRADLPPPSQDTETQYEVQMKLNHQLDWKMRLELDTGHSGQGKVTRGDKRRPEHHREDDVSALGFISTHNAGRSINESVAVTGTDKWKLPGLKPTTKTSKFKKPKDTAMQIVGKRIHAPKL